MKHVPLKPNEAPPDGENAIVVGPAESGEHGGSIVLGSHWTYLSYLPHAPSARENRIRDAEVTATEKGLDHIYVVEASD
jgi:hypothetical protein